MPDVDAAVKRKTHTDYARAWIARQIAKGLCTACVQPAEPGYHQCPKHRAAYRLYASTMRENKRNKLYGLEVGEYDRILAAQNGVCAICHKPETVRGSGGGIKSLAVDHCHETGRVRGLLCNNCNRALGLFNDDASLMQAAVDYLVNGVTRGN